MKITEDQIYDSIVFNKNKINAIYSICESKWNNDLRNKIRLLKRNMNHNFNINNQLPFLNLKHEIEKTNIQPYYNHIVSFTTSIEKKILNSIKQGGSMKKYIKTEKKYKDKNNKIKVVYKMMNSYYIKVKVNNTYKYKKINI